MIITETTIDLDENGIGSLFKQEDVNIDSMAELGELFMEILKNGDIKTLFQPIISLKDGSILGYEALSRGPGNSVFENPERLFDFARMYGRLWELELLCRFKALENISKFNIPYYIFLNVDPHIIDDDKFQKGFTKDFLSEFHINATNIVFEITEKNSVNDMQGFKKIIDNYKNQGYKIAIDDAGSGYSGLKLITDIHPHYLKLDMTLIRDIDKDGLKYALIKTFHDFCTVSDIKLVAEGIETENEMNTLIDIGIDYGQGYLIQRPMDNLPLISEDIVRQIVYRNHKKKELYVNKPTTALVGDICRKNECIGTGMTGAAILELFNSNPSILGLPVVDKKKLTGLIMKDKFFAKLGSQYGYALYTNRPVDLIMDNRPLSVDFFTTIEKVSKMAVARSEDTLYDYIIVTRDSEYYGIVTIKDLLEKTTELEVNYARHLNPLTGLPGNILIEQKLTGFTGETANPFTVLYVDIDNFKVYNDAYGFESGDLVIQYLAAKISECISLRFYPETVHDYFIGHIGGDDFICIIDGHDVEIVCESIIDSFNNGIPHFYSKNDVENGFIISRNRKGTEENFGLASLSIAGVSNKKRSYKDIYELSELSSRIKKKCKEQGGNCYIIE